MNDILGPGIEVIDNTIDTGDADLQRELSAAEKQAALRRFATYGRSYGDSSLDFLVPPRSPSELEFPLDSARFPHSTIIRLAALLRDMVEWPVWSKKTSFPMVRDDAGPGEPLGQCLVTSRFAQNYFLDARLAEVRVKNRDGEEVGPHVVLELPVKMEGGGVEQCYLDLTHDQRLAVGELPQYARDLSSKGKIKLVRKYESQCPYIFVRYQSDQELADKKSKPLQHAGLVLEMVAYRYAYERIQGIERYARPIQLTDLDALAPGEFDADLLAQLDSAVQFVAAHSSGEAGFRPEIQFGLIKDEEFAPDPRWLWKVSGLSGSDEVVTFNDGFTQSQYWFSGRTILLLNFAGGYTPDLLKSAAKLVRPLDDDFELLFAPTVLETFNSRNSISGPIFVRDKKEENPSEPVW